jgi:hypothetical protein
VVITQCDFRQMNRWPKQADCMVGGFAFTTPYLTPGSYHVDAYIWTFGGAVGGYEGAQIRGRINCSEESKDFPWVLNHLKIAFTARWHAPALQREWPSR